GVWTYDAGSEITSSPTVGPDGTVYFGTRNGRLHAVDKNGSARWTHSTDAMIFATPAVDTDGNVFVGSQNGSVYAFASDGSDLWSFATQGPGQLPGAVLASPSIGPDGTVYIGGLYDPTLYALNPNNGTIKWTASFPEGTGFFVSPVIADDGTIYVSLIDSANLYAIDPVDGQLIDTIDLLDIPAITDPATSEDYLDKFPDAQCFTEPAIATDGTIYISLSDPYLRAINPDGSLKWATRLGMAGGFTLAVGNDGLIYAASDDRTLYVVSPDGQLLSVFTGDRFLSFPVIAADGTIYLSDADNTVWAIGTLPCDEDKVNLHRIEDLSADGIVNLVDLSLLAADWLACNEPGYQAGCNYNGIEPRYLTGDIDRDIYVNFEDLQMMAINWLNAD
ncbi:MAG: PQQ-binding-like beta-propeller repeat protein, partial [Anaerohalosphaera sp.]|nr:PQQ-binding-like beta-propeller repeat protein [Anaerohalosphaera sp.]